MPLPLVPLLLAGAVILVAKSRRDKVTDKNGGAEQESTLITDLDALPSEIELNVGDVLTVELPHASGTTYEWTIYMEAVEGDPTLIDSEEVEEPEEAMPGAPYVHRFVLEAAAPGSVRVDFADQNQLDDTEPPVAQGSTIVRIV